MLLPKWVVLADDRLWPPFCASYCTHSHVISCTRQMIHLEANWVFPFLGSFSVHRYGWPSRNWVLAQAPGRENERLVRGRAVLPFLMVRLGRTGWSESWNHTPWESFQVANKKKCAYVSPNFQYLLWKDFLNRQVLFDSQVAPHVKHPFLKHIVATLWATPSPSIKHSLYMLFLGYPLIM